MEFLLEVGCEEIPARFVPPALEELSKHLSEGIKEGRLDSKDLGMTSLGTPRRLCLLIKGLPERQEDLDEEVLGPKVEVAYDKAGQPTKACLGFARSRKVDVADLRKVETDKGQVVAVRRQIEGLPTSEVLGALAQAALKKLGFPKTMRWADGEHAFVRPVHWIVALLDNEVLSFDFAGVTSGRLTRGHRFTHPEAFEIKSAGDFVAALKERDVWVEAPLRRKALMTRAHELAAEVGGKLVEDASLVDEVVQLIECPVPLLGRVQEKFLSLPRNVLVAAMRNHQRYFSIEDDQGKLLNAFVAVGNTPVEEPDLVRHGYERVLTARLEDARFFFEEDLKTPPVELLAKLQEMIFQADLGSYYEKSVRTANLAVCLANQVNLGAWDRVPRVVETLSMKTEAMAPKDQFSWRVARAALLAKTDLLTEMVGEFPELQGEMGGIYARKAGENSAVADALLEQYLPRHAGDSIPESDEGALLSLADRLDTLAGGFGVGLRPSSGADPYALRRQCLGVIAIILSKGYRLSLSEILSEAVRGVEDKVEAAMLAKAQNKARKAAARKKIEAVLPSSVEPFAEKLLEDLLQFFSGRLRGRLADQIPIDVVDAVLEAGMDDMHEAQIRAQALAAFAAQPAFTDLGVAFKRVVNIIKDFEGAEVDEALLKEKEEKQLYSVFVEIKPRFDALLKEGRFDQALELLAVELRGPVDAFFENVLVNDADDLPRQTNRKALLTGLAGMFGRIADFTRLNVRDTDSGPSA